MEYECSSMQGAKEAQYKFHMLAFESIKCGMRKTLRNQLLDNPRIKPFFRDVNSRRAESQYCTTYKGT